MTTNLSNFLKTFLDHLEPELRNYLDSKVAELQSFDPVGQLLAQVVREFTLSGGKRLRGALVVLGYQMVSGRDSMNAEILRLAIAIETLHSFLLIHDDILDRSLERRNKPTVHRVFGEMYKSLLQSLTEKDREHFTFSMAILAGDWCSALAYEALVTSSFPPQRVIAGLKHMHRIIDATLVGQTLDVLRPLQVEVTEADVLKIHQLKTAKYTMEGPLHLGMIMAGAQVSDLKQVSEYAIPVGVAFQIHDDLLGIFGSEKEIGKSVTSDLEEGKKTLLTVFAQTNGTEAERSRITELLGRRDLTQNELEEVRSIFQKSGAVTYCEEKARTLVDEGKGALVRLRDTGIISLQNHDILAELAEYTIGRRM
mgnify:CR=1 FL=1